MMRDFIEFIKERPFQGLFLVVVISLVMSGVGFLVWNNLYHAFKVKDINDPRFDPMAYRFEDYTREADSQRVLEHIFPVGTPRDKVEALLVKKLKAVSHHDNGVNVADGGYVINYNIRYNPFLTQGPHPMRVLGFQFYVGGRHISITFNKNNQLVRLQSMVP
ncbi:MAG: hypothetical protein WC043_10870 [Pseudobdellovibrionaceae bacterium]